MFETGNNTNGLATQMTEQKGTQMTYEQAKQIINRRIEIPAHYDKWMQGARYGTVLTVKQGFNGKPDYILVEMDPPRGVKVWSPDRIKVWSQDWDNIRIFPSFHPFVVTVI